MTGNFLLTNHGTVSHLNWLDEMQEQLSVMAG